VMTEFFEPGATDFFSLLTQVRSLSPDAVIGAAFTEDGVAMLKQYRELRLKPIFFSVGVIWASPPFLSAAGDATNGVLIATGPTTGDSPALTAFRDEFKRDTGNPALPYNITAYDTIRMVVAAMQAAGSTDPVKTADALRHLNYKGLLQDYVFNNSNQSTVTINVNEVTGGQVHVISSLTTS
jgi:branched-chain amino acid transport system substrate-binding protein